MNNGNPNNTHIYLKNTRPVSAMGSPQIITAILCSFVLCLVHATLPKTVSEIKREILDQILPKNGNDILLAPGNTTSGVTEVEMFIHVLEIDKVNDEKMEFTVRLFIRQAWKDYRLKYDSNGHFKYIGINDADLIWTPDVFISNEKKGHTFEITRPNIFVRIFPNGAVLYSKKVSVTVSCPMDLRKYPFDRQECQLRFGSYGSTTDDVVLLWRDYAPVTVNRLMKTPLFELEKFVTTSGIARVNTGDYSYLTAYFYLSRIINYYLIQVYIPSIMFVIMSWLPFWMNRKILIGRLLINLGVMLTYTLIIYDFNKHQPKVSYSTCLQCFTGTCLTFLFLSLIETLVVQILTERESKCASKDCTANGDIQKETSGKMRTVKAWIQKLPHKTNCLDLAARLVVPLAFLIFCIIYFSSVSGFGENDPILIQGIQIKETLVNNSST